MKVDRSKCNAPATGKARRPTVESLMAGANRLSVVEDPSLCRDRMSVVRVNWYSYKKQISRHH